MPTILRGNDDFSTENPYVIERGSNANGHYEKWSDGFIRQWGFTLIGKASTEDVTLPIAMGDVAGMNIVLTVRAVTGAPEAKPWLAALPKNIQAMQVRNYYTGSSLHAMWQVQGY